MKLNYEPRSIEFHFSTVDHFGGKAGVLETRPPELYGIVHGAGGAHGSVTVPLNADEWALLRQIVETASGRATDLLSEAMAARYGSVTVPLNADEWALLRQIVETASGRATDLLSEAMAAR